MTNKTLAVIRTLVVDMGAEADPECWVVWGEDSESRYSVLVPALAGVISVAVRLSGTDEGTRATARLIRWPKLTISELSVEAAGGHRIVAVQVESYVLKGTDDHADRICEFVRGLIATIDNRNPQAIPIAVVQGAAVGGAVVALAGAGTNAPPRPSRPDAAPKGVAATTRAPGAEKPGSKAAGPTVAPAAPKVAAKSAAKPGEKAAAATKPTPAAPTPGALVPIAPVAQPTPLKPIAERAAAAHHGAQPGAQRPSTAHKTPEPAADRPEWVSPHPIEEPPSREPARPRPWTP
jgi:hypothetical protein